MDALGRLFNVVPTGEDVAVNMRDCSAVTFICVGANAETFTIVESIAGSSAANLDAIDHYYKGAATGAGTWSRDNAPTSAHHITTTTANPVAIFTVEDAALSDGKTHVEIQASSSGTVVALTHDLQVQRAPENLPAVSA